MVLSPSISLYHPAWVGSIKQTGRFIAGERRLFFPSAIPNPVVRGAGSPLPSQTRLIHSTLARNTLNDRTLNGILGLRAKEQIGVKRWSRSSYS